ncbi:MAG: DUF2800 domain-containing protein [Planctomycetota bacterium]
MSHDLFNASSTATWIECSYSARYAVPDPLRKQSTVEASEAGTALHSLMEAGGLPEVEAFIDQLENPASTVREHRVKLTDDCGGTIDVLSHGWRGGWNVVTILDGKFGKWDVPAFHNMQLMTYGACTLSSNNAEWFRFVIYQPNGLDDDPWKQAIHHRSEVEAHRERVLRAISDRGAPKPGPHCRWCKAFQSCPAMSTDAGFVMGAMSRRIEDLTTQELVRLLRLIRALGDVKDVYEEALATHLKMGRTADGASLKPGRSFRSWNDDMQAASYLHQHYGPKGVKPVSPAQAEKLGPEGKQYAAVGAHKPEAPLKAVY